MSTSSDRHSSMQLTQRATSTGNMQSHFQQRTMEMTGRRRCHPVMERKRNGSQLRTVLGGRGTPRYRKMATRLHPRRQRQSRQCTPYLSHIRSRLGIVCSATSWAPGDTGYHEVSGSVDVSPGEATAAGPVRRGFHFTPGALSISLIGCRAANSWLTLDGFAAGQV